MTLTIRNEEEIRQAAREFLATIGSARHIAFYGPMGAGKTTFTAALCRELGVSDEVNSPTFSIINEYRDRQGTPVFHFDFYRIEDEREAFELGLEEYFESGALCLMEWPENVESFLPEDTLRVNIEVADGVRILSYE